MPHPVFHPWRRIETQNLRRMTVALPDRMVFNAVDEHILRTLLYYDIFHYPLRADEVHRFLGAPLEHEDYIYSRLRVLAAHRYISQFGDFFGIQPSESDAVRRAKGNAEAERLTVLARKKARLIGSFPFVRGVMASGSLSKGYMDKKSDLDFFIVTAPGRLWIARTLLVMYKRIFLFNSHKYFCVNYFVDEQHLEIEEKNLFTATELATALPLYGPEHYHNLLKANPWLINFFPNFRPRTIEGVAPSKRRGLKKILEAFFNLAPFSRLNHYFKKMTLQRWEKLYRRDYPDADFKVAFKTKDHASKNHPRNYQRKVMDLYADKVKAFGLSPLRSCAEEPGK